MSHVFQAVSNLYHTIIKRVATSNYRGRTLVSSFERLLISFSTSNMGSSECFGDRLLYKHVSFDVMYMELIENKAS